MLDILLIPCFSIGMNSNQAFIATCIEVIRIDGEVSNQEMNRCQEVLQAAGFSSEEIEKTVELMDTFSEDELVQAISALPAEQKKNLLDSIISIAGSDGLDSDEYEFINSVRSILSDVRK
jgi:uncharacterized tellurite resistance protein B-like protein